jgi:imidazolonepropionase-like amidohydrolase
MVQALASTGVQGVKAIYGGTGLPRLSAEILAALGTAAHELGLWFAVHTGTLDEVRTAALAGADTVEHGVTSGELLDHDTLALLVERNITYVPTLVIAANELARVRPHAVPQLTVNLLAARDAGVRLGAGTDTQGAHMSFGTSLIDELEAFVVAGLSAREALDTATRNAGYALQNPRIGLLAPGAYGDLLVVDGQPWQNIADLRSIRAVVQDGQVVGRP